MHARTAPNNSPASILCKTISIRSIPIEWCSPHVSCLFAFPPEALLTHTTSDTCDPLRTVGPHVRLLDMLPRASYRFDLCTRLSSCSRVPYRSKTPLIDLLSLRFDHLIPPTTEKSSKLELASCVAHDMLQLFCKVMRKTNSRKLPG